MPDDLRFAHDLADTADDITLGLFQRDLEGTAVVTNGVLHDETLRVPAAEDTR